MLKPVAMKQIAVLGLRENRQNVVSILHDLGVVHLEPLSKSVAGMLRNERDDDLNRQVSDQLLRIRALKSVLPAQLVSECCRFTSLDELIETAQSITIDEKVASLERQKEDLLTKLKEIDENLRLVKEFSFFPEDLSLLELRLAHSFFGRVESEKFAAFKEALQVDFQDMVLYFQQDKDITRFVLVVLPEFPSHALATVIQTYGAKLEPVPRLYGKPTELVEQLKKKRNELTQTLQGIDQQLKEISKQHFATILVVEEQLAIESRKLEVAANLGVTHDVFALEGWVPVPKLEQLKKTLDRYAPGITEVYELESEELPPTLLTNPKKFRLFESFIRFYSLPSSNEFDPTLIFAIVFPIFFGMMLGDVGYGLVILVGSLWVIQRVEGGKRGKTIMPRKLIKFAKLILSPPRMVKLAKAMIPGCIVAIGLGFLFNLYFGFHLNGYLFGLLNAQFGLNLPSNGTFFDPISSFGLRKLLLISGYIGLILVSFGLVLGIVNHYWQKEKRGMLGKIGWLVFAWGIAQLGLALIGGQTINPMKDLVAGSYFGMIFAGIGLMFLGEGVRALMELPSIISHILSYTRIVGILVASVIFAHLIDYIFLKALHKSELLIITGAVILLVGHFFNNIIGIFEPGIQGARLIYVEYFSKFFHGRGRPFRPFGTARQFTVEQYELEKTVQPAIKKKVKYAPILRRKKGKVELEQP
ncbi:MAG: V-type ATP synthase subunit I [Nitrososphaerales archaeon]